MPTKIFSKTIFLLLIGTFLPLLNVIAAEEDSNHYCSVFTDEGKLTHRVCDDAGLVTFKAYYPEKLKVKKFSWVCQAETISNQIGGDLNDSGRLKLISNSGKVGFLTMFNQQGKLYYFWVERGEEKVVPCGQANWFTCKNSPATFWIASSEQNGGNFKAKKIVDLKDYPAEGIFTVPTEKNLLILWQGNNDWNSFSSPEQINVGRIDFNNFSPVIKSEAKKDEINSLESLETLRSSMANTSLLTKEELDLNWEKLSNGPINLDLPQETFKLEVINENSGGNAIFLELKKKVDSDEETDESENETAQTAVETNDENNKEKDCFYEKPGIYRPSLKIEYEDGQKTVCAPMPIVEVSAKIGCQVRVKKTDSKDRYAEKLKIYLGDGVEARIDGECLEDFEPQWTIYGASPDDSSKSLSGRNVKLLPLAGIDPLIKAEMENEETGKSLQCKEAEIIAREKLRWR